MSFQQHNSVYFIHVKVKSNLIASFDLDWTLTYSEKHLFPKETDDIYIFPNRKAILEKLISDGYNIVIFTNQFAKSKKEKLNKVKRITTFVKKLDLPISVYISTEKDTYRKPNIDMWNLFKKHHTENIKKVLYVGDALGRPQDFSDSDKIFGESINADIKSPKDFFTHPEKHYFTPLKELVVCVGMPGSGKSSYHKEHLQDHLHIEQDKFGNRAKVLKELDKSLLTGKSIYIDATNPVQEGRYEYYEKAKNHGYSIKVLYFLVNGTGFNKLRDKPVPDIVYHVYFKKLEPPTPENTPGDLVYIY
jgi:DNA 3'-phosphatase